MMKKLNVFPAIVFAVIFAMTFTAPVSAAEAAKVVTWARFYCTDGIAPEGSSQGDGSTLDVVEVKQEENAPHEISLELQMTTAAKAKGFVFDFAAKGFTPTIGDISEEGLSKGDEADPPGYSSVSDVTFGKELIKDGSGNVTGFRISLGEEKELEAGSYKLKFKLENEFKPGAGKDMGVFSVDLAGISCKTGGAPPEVPEGLSATFANNYFGTGSSEKRISMQLIIANGNPVHADVSHPVNTNSEPILLDGYKMKFYFQAISSDIKLENLNFELNTNRFQYGGGTIDGKQETPTSANLDWNVRKLSESEIIDEGDHLKADHLLTLTIADPNKGLKLYEDQLFVVGFNFVYKRPTSWGGTEEAPFIDLESSYSYVEVPPKGDENRFSFSDWYGYKNFPRVEVEDPSGTNISGDDIDDSSQGGTPVTETYTPEEGSGSGITIISTGGGNSEQAGQSALRRNPVPIRLSIDDVSGELLAMENLHSLTIEVRRKDSAANSPDLHVWFIPAPVAVNAGENLTKPPVPAANSNIFLLKNATTDDVDLGPDGDGSKGNFDASLLPDFKSGVNADAVSDSLDFLVYPDWDEGTDSEDGTKTFVLEVTIEATIFKDESYTYIEKDENGTETKRKMVLYNYYDLPQFTVTKTLSAVEFKSVQ